MTAISCTVESNFLKLNSLGLQMEGILTADI